MHQSKSRSKVHTKSLRFLFFTFFVGSLIGSSQLLAQESFEIFSKKGLYGIKNQEGKVSVPPNYERIGWSEGLVLPVGDVFGYLEEGGWGLISIRGKRITTPRYYSLSAIHSDLIIASQIGRFSNELIFGALNSKGEVVIDFKYHSIRHLSGVLVVSERRNGQSYYGLISEQNETILNVKNHSVYHFFNDLFVFETDSGALGVVSKKGGMIVPASLDSIGEVTGGTCKIFKGGRVGLMDTTALITITPEYKALDDHGNKTYFATIEVLTPTRQQLKVSADSIRVTDNDFVIIYRNGFAEVENMDGEIIGRHKETLHVEPYRDNLVVTTKLGVEVFDLEGKHWKGNRFDDVRLDQHCLYAKSSAGWHVYNAFGTKLSKRAYEEVIAGSNNLIPVRKKRLWGYIDHNGEMAISFRFDKASRFTGQLAEVEYVGYKTLINQFGEQVGELAYDSIMVQDNNTAIVKIKNRTDLVNRNGAAVFQTYNELIPFSAGYVERTSEGHLGLIGKKGKVLFHPSFSEVRPFESKFIELKSSDGVGLSLADGSWLIRPTDDFSDILGMTEGYAPIKKNDQWGFVNKYQQLVIANRYDSVRNFSEGLAAVQLGDTWGFVDKRERIVVQPNLDSVEDFNQGFSIVSRKGLFGVIKKDGSFLLEMSHDSLSRLSDIGFLAKKGDKVGIYDNQGGQVLPISFEGITLSTDGLIVRRRGKYGVVDQSGQYVIPLQYDLIESQAKNYYACFLYE